MGRDSEGRQVLVIGGRGFVGTALVAALSSEGHRVVATSRRPMPSTPRVSWKILDLLDAPPPPGLWGCSTVVYLAHSLGESDVFEADVRCARTFVSSLSASHRRVVFLGGPRVLQPSPAHLSGRCAAGEILRSAPVPTLELRASMIVGRGGTSWTICRDMALLSPLLVRCPWLETELSPIHIDDVVRAVVHAISMPFPDCADMELCGDRPRTAVEILQMVRRASGRRGRVVPLPVGPRLGSVAVRCLTRAPWDRVGTLVDGLRARTMPAEPFWNHAPLHPEPLQDGIRRELQGDPGPRTLSGLLRWRIRGRAE